jgi:hypothetical protein
MSQSTKSSDQSLNVRKVVGLTITDPTFRSQIAGKAVADIREAIDSRSQDLGFQSGSLTDTTLTALSSVTSDELTTLSEIFGKVKDIPVEPYEMF